MHVCVCKLLFFFSKRDIKVPTIMVYCITSCSCWKHCILTNSYCKMIFHYTILHLLFHKYKRVPRPYFICSSLDWVLAYSTSFPFGSTGSQWPFPDWLKATYRDKAVRELSIGSKCITGKLSIQRWKDN